MNRTANTANAENAANAAPNVSQKNFSDFEAEFAEDFAKNLPQDLITEFPQDFTAQFPPDFTAGLLPKFVPKYDPDFRPIILLKRQYEAAVRSATVSEDFVFSVKRRGKAVRTFRLEVIAERVRPDLRPVTLLYVERLVKTRLWIVGGDELELQGAKYLTESISVQYRPGGRRAFDYAFFSEVFGTPFRVTITDAAKRVLPEADSCRSEAIRISESMPTIQNSNANGEPGAERNLQVIGMDLGGSTLKLTAIRDGEIVFASTTPWSPKTKDDTAYHFQKMECAIMEARSYLSRIDFIGISCAGIVLNNQVIAGSLFRCVPKEDHPLVLNLFARISRRFGGVPYRIVNDGEIAALAAKTAGKNTEVLGLTLGTSLGCGYLNSDGMTTENINEAAFVPLDISQNAVMDEWSEDFGVGVSYLSQDAAIKLASRAGFRFSTDSGNAKGEDDESASSTEDKASTEAEAFTDGNLQSVRFRMITEQLKNGAIAAREVFEDMGIYLAYALAFYKDLFVFSDVVLLGGVAAGEHGAILRGKAEEVLRAEFPELAESIRFLNIEDRPHIQDEVAANIGFPKTES